MPAPGVKARPRPKPRSKQQRQERQRHRSSSSPFLSPPPPPSAPPVDAASVARSNWATVQSDFLFGCTTLPLSTAGRRCRAKSASIRSGDKQTRLRFDENGSEGATHKRDKTTARTEDECAQQDDDCDASCAALTAVRLRLHDVDGEMQRLAKRRRSLLAEMHSVEQRMQPARCHSLVSSPPPADESAEPTRGDLTVMAEPPPPSAVVPCPSAVSCGRWTKHSIARCVQPASSASSDGAATAATCCTSWWRLSALFPLAALPSVPFMAAMFLHNKQPHHNAAATDHTTPPAQSATEDTHTAQLAQPSPCRDEQQSGHVAAVAAEVASSPGAVCAPTEAAAAVPVLCPAPPGMTCTLDANDALSMLPVASADAWEFSQASVTAAEAVTAIGSIRRSRSSPVKPAGSAGRFDSVKRQAPSSTALLSRSSSTARSPLAPLWPPARSSSLASLLNAASHAPQSCAAAGGVRPPAPAIVAPPPSLPPPAPASQPPRRPADNGAAHNQLRSTSSQPASTSTQPTARSAVGVASSSTVSAAGACPAGAGEVLVPLSSALCAMSFPAMCHAFAAAFPPTPSSSSSSVRSVPVPMFASCAAADLQRWMADCGMKPKPHRLMADKLAALFHGIARTAASSSTSSADDERKDATAHSSSSSSSQPPPAVVPSSVPVSASVTARVRRFIRQSPALYLQCLLMQPLELQSLHLCCRGAGIEVSREQLQAILDADGCTAAQTPLKREGGRQKKRRRLV